MNIFNRLHHSWAATKVYFHHWLIYYFLSSWGKKENSVKRPTQFPQSQVHRTKLLNTCGKQLHRRRQRFEMIKKRKKLLLTSLAIRKIIPFMQIF